MPSFGVVGAARSARQPVELRCALACRAKNGLLYRATRGMSPPGTPSALERNRSLTPPGHVRAPGIPHHRSGARHRGCALRAAVELATSTSSTIPKPRDTPAVRSRHGRSGPGAWPCSASCSAAGRCAAGRACRGRASRRLRRGALLQVAVPACGGGHARFAEQAPGNS
jgi:hypothetical protein